MDKKGTEKKVSHVEWMSLQIKKIIHICLKLTIGNLLEIIKYKITGFKLSKLLTFILQKKMQCNNREAMGLGEHSSNLFGTKIRRQQGSEKLLA
jgi:hypothetical protein